MISFSALIVCQCSRNLPEFPHNPNLIIGRQNPRYQNEFLSTTPERLAQNSTAASGGSSQAPLSSDTSTPPGSLSQSCTACSWEGQGDRQAPLSPPTLMHIPPQGKHLDVVSPGNPIYSGLSLASLLKAVSTRLPF